MDINLLIQFLSPCLPFLVKVGDKVLDGAVTKIGEDVWEQAKAIWAKLHPHVAAQPAALKAAQDVASHPEDRNLQASLGVALKQILDSDPLLAAEIDKILQSSTARSSDNIQMNANAYDQSTVKQVGKIEADTVNF